MTDEEIEIYKLIIKAKKVLRPGKFILNLNTRGDILKPEFHIIGKDPVDNL